MITMRRGSPSASPSGDAASEAGRGGGASGPALVAWVDGGARGNPGPAGYGACIFGEGGDLLREESVFLGVATNNVAEYSGLLAVLRIAAELGARSLHVYADSELMVRQMNGEYRVRNERLKPLHASARALAAALPRFFITHIPREKNRNADKLANEAMDRGA